MAAAGATRKALARPAQLAHECWGGGGPGRALLEPRLDSPPRAEAGQRAARVRSGGGVRAAGTFERRRVRPAGASSFGPRRGLSKLGSPRRGPKRGAPLWDVGWWDAAGVTPRVAAASARTSSGGVNAGGRPIQERAPVRGGGRWRLRGRSGCSGVVCGGAGAAYKSRGRRSSRASGCVRAGGCRVSHHGGGSSFIDRMILAAGELLGTVLVGVFAAWWAWRCGSRERRAARRSRRGGRAWLGRDGRRRGRGGGG